MPPANRTRWMRDYMTEYRQGKLRGEVVGRHLNSGNPHRREKLKKAHRLDSFKYRLSKLLSSQYEILLCIQYALEYGVFKNGDGLVLGYDEEFCTNSKEVIDCFPMLKDDFKAMCNKGGGNIFKVFLIRKFDQVIESVVGVLDKAALLEDLQRLSNQRCSECESALNKVKNESRHGTWRKLNFQRDPWIWLDDYIECYSLTWTARNRPQ